MWRARLTRVREVDILFAAPNDSATFFVALALCVLRSLSRSEEKAGQQEVATGI